MLTHSPATYPMPDLDRSPTWHLDAACAGQPVDLFFSEDREWRRKHQQAKQLCMTCPVREKCLAEHINEDYGIFGGMSPKERRAMKRRTA